MYRLEEMSKDGYKLPEVAKREVNDEEKYGEIMKKVTL